MRRCLELAANGLGMVAPNPMVGCVIVCEDKIIGEGFHQRYGEGHAEVNAINSLANQALLQHSTLYVSLEPCTHFGKTPPCVDLIIQNKIPHVVIGSTDPNPMVSGKGIEKLKNEGIKVTTGILNHECRELNKRFFTFYEKKRPFIILKWAQSKDGYIDKLRSEKEVGQQIKISAEATNLLVHQWRSQEQAIMIGTNTALLDNPQLNARFSKGKNPFRIVIDNELKIPQHYHLLDGASPTLVFTYLKKENSTNVEYVIVPRQDSLLNVALTELHKRNIQSVLIEGGTKLLNSFIQQNLWDEARIIVGETIIQNGVKAPELNHLTPVSELTIDRDTIHYYYNKCD